MITTKQLTAVLAVTALLAVGVIGVGYAYTASTSNTGNTAGVDYLIVEQEDAKYVSPMVTAQPTFDTLTAWQPAVDAVEDDPDTDADEAVAAVEAHEYTTITGIAGITPVENTATGKTVYQIGTQKITISNNTDSSVELPDFLLTIDFGAKANLNTATNEPIYKFYVVLSDDADMVSADTLIPVDISGTNAVVNVASMGLFDNSLDSKNVIMAVEIMDADTTVPGTQMDRTKDYWMIDSTGTGVAFTYRATAGEAIVADDVDLAVGDEAGQIDITTPGIDQEVVTYLSLDTSIATVDASGAVTGVAAGVTKIWASVTVDGVFYCGFVDVTVTSS